jgi:hypothetical protein
VVFSHVEKIGRVLKFHKLSGLPFGPPVANEEAMRTVTRTMTRALSAALLASTAFLPIAAQQPYPQRYPQQQYPQQQPQQPQQQAPPQQADDQGYAPEHGVARISLVNGDVSVRRGDSGELSEAALNGPLVVNDHLATGQSGRAEIQFDWGNMIRLGPDTEVRLGELEDRRYLVQVATGTTTFRVLRDSGADVEISTPTVSVRPAEPGSYRVTVFPDGRTEITVRAGHAEIFSPRGTETLAAGRTMEARGTPSDPEYMINAAIPQDDWDRWNVDRDRGMERSSSYRYVSPDVAGGEDLDSYGRWTTDPQYGNVWVPNEDPGWAPYRDGRWMDEPYYGWTWVSDDPWGWAPYHYGNWYMSPFGWAWYPGSIYGRQYWRPAMVGFFGWGGGGGIGLGFGFGNVGWVPLAPFERFRPWYGRGFTGTSIVNVSAVSAYRNARSVNGRNGVTSIAAADFGRGRAVNTNNFVRASNTDLARAGAVQGRLPITASADARRMSDARVNTQAMPRVNANTSFAQRSPAQGGSRGVSQGQGRQAQVIGQSGSARPSVIGGGNSNGNTGGWRTFNGGGSPAVSGAGSNTQQPVRISPPIVRERSPAPQASRPQPSSGGFGAPRPQSGGGSRSSGHSGGGHKR